MKFLDDELKNSKDESKPVSSTIELAKKLGILKEEQENSAQELSDNLKIEENNRHATKKANNIETTINSNNNDKLSALEQIESVEQTKKKKSKNGHLVTSDDVDNYIKEKKLKYVTIQENENNTINTKDYIYETSANSYATNSFIPFVFKGEAREYFKIWIVNIALTILTLGIYSAWAKVRNNRYIYGNTYLNGSNFEFNADPKRILYGRLIVIGFYGLFYLSTNVLYSQKIALAIVGLFLLLMPWLIRQAINFRLKSASYRNIHFRYHGKARSFYALAIGAILLFTLIFVPAILTGILHLGNKNLSGLAGIFTVIAGILFMVIAIPILYLKLKKLIINNSAYGLAKFNFNAKKSEVVGLFMRMGMVTFVFSILLGLAAALASGMFNAVLHSFHIDFKSPTGNVLIYVGVATIYLASIGLYKGINDGYLSNFTRNNTKVKDCPLKGEISPIKLGFISMTNAILIVLSLGLLYPWAKMRYLKYKTEHTYFKCKDYSQFKSDGRDRGTTVGAETMDFFDIDIGV